MADIILTLKQVEDFFQRTTTQMLGLNPDASQNQGKVRIAWPTDGQPGFRIDEDVVFLKINNPDEQITKQRDVAYSERDQDYANRKVTYTRVHTIRWTLYGPNSYDNAETIKNQLFNPEYKAAFFQKNLFLVLDVEAPTRFPEQMNGQWWERVDFQARFNEKITRDGSTPYIKSVVPQILKG